MSADEVFALLKLLIIGSGIATLLLIFLSVAYERTEE